MAYELQLLLLGRPQIMQDGSPLFIFHKAQALFYYLVVTGRPHQRSSLLNLLWGHIPENNRKNNLRVTLSYLRKNLGDYLMINRHTVSFKPTAPCWIDVEELKTVLQSSPKTIERLQEVVKLYQGPFLEGFQVPEEKEYEAWVAITRRKIQELVIQAMHSLALRYQEQKDYVNSIETLNRLLTLQPWREESHQLLMILLASSGQRSAALEQYDICRQTLTEHKRTSSPELTKLYEDISTGRIATPHNGINMVTPTVGSLVEVDLLPQRQMEGPQQVTVMYCHWHDIRTQPTQAPEIWQTLQQYCTQKLLGIINRFSGQVIYQYNGEMLVAFNRASVEENDAQQAIQCGWQILKDIELSGTIKTHKLSIAIHTGLVLMEKVKINGHHHLNMLGQPLQIVQQIAEHAAPDALLISDTTYSLVKEVFPCQKFSFPDNNILMPVIYQLQGDNLNLHWQNEDKG
jgi:DNA-binding SARP family transcriptional activator